MFRINLRVNVTPDINSQHYLVQFNNVPNSFGKYSGSIYNEKSQRVYSLDVDDSVVLLEKLLGRIKMLGNSIICTDETEVFEHNFMRFLAHAINEGSIEELIVLMRSIQKYAVCYGN